MNKQCHRVVFNAARSLCMAVAEHASTGRGARKSRRQARASGSAISLGVLSALTMSLVQAQIVADPSAPLNNKPIVSQTDNGIALVNIAPPSAGGVSRNVYQQMDVARSGLILNNTRTDAQTQLGGWVPGNARLSHGSAAIILNEVHSNNPSHLNGFIEVAGQKAQVVIANPSGITCDGCGFINASRATLSTGTPLLSNGHLDGFLVQGGTVRITGDGLNSINTDYTDIIARALEVNAGIWANDLTVITGLNRVNANLTSITELPPAEHPTTPPSFAIDTAELGGMYAGHIRLVSSEAGVGVRHHGAIGAWAGDVLIDVNGELRSRGLIHATGDVSVTAQELNHQGATTHAQGHLRIDAQQNVDNRFGGLLSAQQGMTLSVLHLLNEKGAISAGHGDDESGTAKGDITVLLRGGLLNNEGLMLATNDITINANTAHDALTLPWDDGYRTEADIQSFRGTLHAGGHLKIGVGDARENWRSLNYSQGSLIGNAGIELHLNAIETWDVAHTQTGLSRLTTQGDLTVRAGAYGTDSTHPTGGGLWGQIQAGKNIALSLACGADACGRMKIAADVSAGGAILLSSITDTIKDPYSGHFIIQASAKVIGKDIDIRSTGMTNLGHIEGDSIRISAEEHWRKEWDPEKGEYVIQKYGAHIGNGGVILGNRIQVEGESFHGIGWWGEWYDVGSLIARDSLDIGAKEVSTHVAWDGDELRTAYAEAGEIISLGTLSIGGHLDANGKAAGQADLIYNNAGLIESAGDMRLGAKEIQNINGSFRTEVREIGSPQQMTWLQPKGSAARVPIGNLRWQKWERAGQYRFATSPDAYADMPARLGQTPLPVPDQEDCANLSDEASCATVPNAQYLRGDPAWAYFKVTQPDLAPEAPNMAEPLPPTLPTPVDPGKNAEAAAQQAYQDQRQAYDAAWSAYNSQKQAHDTAMAEHAQAKLDWQEQTANRYDELSDRIVEYNATFADDVIREWTQYDFTRHTSRTVVERSKPGQIISGGNLTLDAQSVLNDKSRIVAGGALIADLDKLDNREAMGEYILRDEGTVRQTYTERRRSGMFGKKRTYRKWSDAVGYLPPDDVTLFPLGIGELTYGSTYVGTDISDKPRTDVPELIPTMPPNILLGAVQAQIQNKLTEVAANPTAGYLLETNPRFTENRSWASSDVLLSSLGFEGNFDGNDALRRLGDGFVEQRLIREQVLSLTGQRYLGNHLNDEQQYLSLMNAAATFAHQHELIPGVALTAQQMAALTSDIVWLETQFVTLPDGRVMSALVPRVYLAPRKGDLVADGALFGSALVGNTVSLSVADQLINGGGIAGRELTLVQAGHVLNEGGGIVGGTTVIQSKTDIVNVGGTIAGRDAVALDAGRDIIVETTTRHAQSEYVQRPSDKKTSGLSILSASPLLKLKQPVKPSAKYEATSIERMAGVYVTGRDGTLLASAGQDLTVIGAKLRSQGEMHLLAGGSIGLETVKTGGSLDVKWDSKRSLSESWSEEVGASLHARGDITMQAGGQVMARGSQVLADLGSLEATAAGDITLDAKQSSEYFDERRYKTDKGTFSKTTTATHDTHSATQAQGTTLSAQEVLLQSGQDVTLVGSTVVSTRGVTVLAKGDVSLLTAQESVQESHQQQVKKSGVSVSLAGGIGMGRSQADQAQQGRHTTHSGSSVSGQNVAIAAAHDVTIQSSMVLADQDITVQAGRNLDITTADNTQETSSSFKSRSTQIGLIGGLSPNQTLFSDQAARQNAQETVVSQSTSVLSANAGDLTLTAGTNSQHRGTSEGNVSTEGADLLAGQGIHVQGNAVTLGAAIVQDVDGSMQAQQRSTTVGAQLAGTVGSRITSAVTLAQSSAQTDNERLANAQRLKAAYDAYKLSQGVNELVAAGGKSNAADSSTGAAFGINVSLGTSRSEQQSSHASTQVRGTSAQGQSIAVSSRDTDITAVGGKLQADDITLDAAQNIKLVAAQNTASQQSSSKGSNASIGATVGIGEQSGISFQVGVGGQKGKADGSETTHDNTLVTATDRLTIKSGANTTLAGAQVAGKTVQMDVGGQLDISTLQDSSHSESEQSSFGVNISLCIPPICYGNVATGSINVSQSGFNHTYQSAAGQSGIAAGDKDAGGGFDIKVQGGTSLTGATITSTADQSQNSLQTAGLSFKDLQNQQNTSSHSSSIGVAYGGGSAVSTLAANTASNVLGNVASSGGLPENGSQSSQTLSVISPATVTVTGSGDAQKDQASQQAAATLTKRDASTANGALTNTLTLQQAAEVQQDMQRAQENAQAGQLVGSVAFNVAGDIAQHNEWKDGSPQKIALHGVAGLIQATAGGQNGAAGALAAMGNEALTLAINEYITQQVPITSDMTPAQASQATQARKELAEAAASMLGATTVALAGGKAQDVQLGGQVALNADRFNRQLHRVEAAQLDALKKGKSASEQARLDAAACALVRCADGVPKDDPQYARLAAMQAEGQAYKAEQQALLATGQFVYQPILDPARDALTRHGEALTRAGGAVNLAAGTVGMVGGGVIATGGALGCAPSAGISCAAVPLGGYLAYESSQQAQQGSSALLSPYQSTEGQRVLDSFSVQTYPGERDPLKDVGVDAAKLGLTALAGKLIPKALADAEGLSIKPTVAEKFIGKNVDVDKAAQAKATLENNFYRDGSVADPSKTMSPTGEWKPAQMLTSAEADARVYASLPKGAVVTRTESADVLNAAVIKENINFKPPYIANTEAVVFKTSQPAEFVRVYVAGGRSGQNDTWMMPSAEIKGLTPEQIASKYALPQVPTHITDVKVPAGVQMRATSAGDITIFPNSSLGGNGGGGGVQFEVLSKPKLDADFEKWFTNARPIK